jgi:hypothetical protein
LTQLISNVRNGLPGIVTAVIVGAPGPVHGAAAAGVSDAAPSKAVATVPEKYETRFLYLVMNETLPGEKPFPHGGFLNMEH